MADHVHKELVAPNDTRHLAKIREVVQESAAIAAFDKVEIGRIVLAVDEAVANIMEHAYEEMEDAGDIRVTIDVDQTRFQVVVQDSGKEFDPNTLGTPDVAEHVHRGTLEEHKATID